MTERGSAAAKRNASRREICELVRRLEFVSARESSPLQGATDISEDESEWRDWCKIANGIITVTARIATT
jgi:hypothetical protein